MGLKTKIMQSLLKYSIRLISQVDTKFTRHLYSKINWESRLIAVTGSRGVGKTTMLMQYAKMNLNYMNGKVLYVSLDHIWFSTRTLFSLAEEFSTMGGEVMILDEVHKYENWATEIKNIYDYLPELKVVFTGSSLLKIVSGNADLSRRVAEYHLSGMSFREFLEYEYGIVLPVYELDNILGDHTTIALDVMARIKPVPAFKQYLVYGYYPFYKEDMETYHQRLLSTINTILEVDLTSIEPIERSTIFKIRKALSIIAESVPYVPNITELSQKIGTTRPQLLKFLGYLSDCRLLQVLPKDASGFKRMEKPEKIYLGNTNYAYAFGQEKTDVGNVRETFFFNQLSHDNEVAYTPYTDFLVNGKYSFEIGGKNKKKKQIEDITDSFVVKDDIEMGVLNTIPLWIFGLMY